jgi:hypothetical protein
MRTPNPNTRHPFRPAEARAASVLRGGGSFSPLGQSFSDVEHECEHGRLAGDRTPACGCWPQEPYPRGVTPARERRAR